MRPMRTIFRLTGTLLVAVSLGGLLLLALGSIRGWLAGISGAARPVELTSVGAAVTPSAAPTTSGAAELALSPLPTTPASIAPGTGPGGPDDRVNGPPWAPYRPISRVVIPRISLEAEVVPAELVQKGTEVTWEVPAFKAGHAALTAGAGERGNAVLVGHVSSRRSGNVFGDLDEVRVGDQVQVFSGQRQFDYRVVEVRTVARTDVSVVQPTETASLSLITCTGVWFPGIQDYTQRLVVRTELTGQIPAAPAVVAATPDPSAPAAAAAPTPLRTILDERFDAPRETWLHDPRSTAWYSGGAYHLYARQPGQFVALGAPGGQPLRDVVVTGRFRKIGGPPGGGYGLIIRDQGPGPRDGLNQGGNYYVLEVGDRGEIGAWRRAGDAWVALLPWTPSQAVRPGGVENEVTVRALGQRLTLVVNGVEVTSLEDAVLTEGAVGIFVGGDLNGVALERLIVQVPG